MSLQNKKILLVEDDNEIGLLLKEELKKAGCQVVEARNGRAGLKEFTEQSFDLCLFDVTLPKMDGLELAREIRACNKHVPILFLSAKTQSEDRIAGFRSGGDDYITKPFNMEELLLRMQVFLRRTAKDSEEVHDPKSGIWQVGKFRFSLVDQRLSFQKTHQQLTYKETTLLRYFCRHANRIMTRSDILGQVWGSDDYYSGRSLDVFVSRLRKYLKPDENVKISNLHGVGFRFHAEVKILKEPQD